MIETDMLLQISIALTLDECTETVSLPCKLRYVMSKNIYNTNNYCNVRLKSSEKNFTHNASVNKWSCQVTLIFWLRKYKLNFQWRKQDTSLVFTWDWLVFIFLSCNTSIKGMIFYFRIILFSALLGMENGHTPAYVSQKTHPQNLITKLIWR